VHEIITSKTTFIICKNYFFHCLYRCRRYVAEPKVIIKFKFDAGQARLNNFGQPTTIAAGNAAQTPLFNFIPAHYIEFSPNATAQLGQGYVAYQAPETSLGGSTAIDFSTAIQVKEGEAFLEIPSKDF
jgi:hypothetical protein